MPATLPASSEWLVVDAYGDLRARLIEGRGNAALAVFEDLGRAPDSARLVIAPAGAHGGPHQSVLSGLEHACLRRAYWDTVKLVQGAEVTRMLVSVGAAPPPNLAAEVAEELAAAVPTARIRLVGPAAPAGVEATGSVTSLHEELSAADLVVTAAGQTLLEALALGRPVVTFPVADNQRPTADLVASAGLSPRPARPLHPRSGHGRVPSSRRSARARPARAGGNRGGRRAGRAPGGPRAQRG